jgi:peptidoglycan/xylan/chitin deacetylase (PgdA/CDA1 family)
LPEPRLSVSLTVDFDALSSWIARGEGATEISRGEFDAIAVPRLLDLFRRNSIRTTFFVPGHTALAYPDLVREAAADGHEIAHHGWVHENLSANDPEQQREIFERGFEALEQVAAVRPVGYRAAGVGADFGTTTVDLLQELGFEYDSSCSGTDYTAYYLRRGDRWSKTEAYVFGTPVDIVEVPVAYALDDWQLFEFRGGWTARQALPREIFELWRDEFDFAYAECPGGSYDLTLHPIGIGRGPRLAMLERLIEHVRSKPDVVFEPLCEYVARWRREMPLARWLELAPHHSGLRSLQPSGRSGRAERP